MDRLIEAFVTGAFDGGVVYLRDSSLKQVVCAYSICHMSRALRETFGVLQLMNS
jgi:hypothetical protein